MDSIVILVKNKFEAKVNARTQLLFSVPVMLFLWIALRKIFRMNYNSPNQDISRIFIDTWGTFLSSNNSFVIRNRPERIMNYSVNLLSILISNFVTAIMFNYLLTQEMELGIDTFKDLSSLGVEILISDELKFALQDAPDHT